MSTYLLVYNADMGKYSTSDSGIELKTDRILNRLRSDIVVGRFKPGHRLPTFVELEGKYGVGRAVLQHVIAELKRDGFVRSVNRQGMYVAQDPPHLHQYGIVVDALPNEVGWVKWMEALTNEALRIEKKHPLHRFRFYQGVQHPELQDGVFRQLQEDVDSDRLAGLILTSKTYDILCRSSLSSLDIPKAFIWANEDSNLTPNIRGPGSNLYHRALLKLKEKGRQRIAIIHMADTSYSENHPALYAECGLKYHRPWIQRIGRSHPEFAAELIYLLMDYPEDQRPDGLIIGDDNLVEHISRGIVECGIRVGKDLDIITHCNWPWPPASVLPMTHIGYDVTDLLHRAMDLINQQRLGKTPPDSQEIPALFKHELCPRESVLAEQEW